MKNRHRPFAAYARRPFAAYARLQSQKLARANIRLTGNNDIQLKVGWTDELLGARDLRFLKKGNQFLILLQRRSWRFGLSPGIQGRIATWVYWLHMAEDDIIDVVVDGTDGHVPSSAKFSFSSCLPDVVPVPDGYFFQNRGFANTDKYAKDLDISWNERTDDIVWRGGINGCGLHAVDDFLQDNLGVVQRLRMAMKCKSPDVDIDFRFARNPPIIDEPVLSNAGFLADLIPMHDWGSKKFAIDIDGYSNTWDNFIHRLKLGCCVLKVDSQYGFRQWYYNDLTPYEHYIPIKADLSNLAEQVDWVRANDAQAREIAANGQTVARAMTFESESKRAGRIIDDNWKT